MVGCWTRIDDPHFLLSTIAIMLTLLFFVLGMLAVAGFIVAHPKLRLTNGVLAMMSALLFGLYVYDNPRTLTNYLLLFLFSMAALGYLWPSAIENGKRRLFLLLSAITTTTTTTTPITRSSDSKKDLEGPIIEIDPLE